MDLQLSNEVAVVIGAASGLGKAISLEFAREGAKLVLVDIAPTVESVASEIQRAWKTPAWAFTADVTDYQAMQAVAAAVIFDWGRCDHVIVPAGIGSGKYGFPFWKLEPADWDRVLRVNLLGPVHAAHAFSPPMIAARQGTFLFFTSIAGQIGRFPKKRGFRDGDDTSSAVAGAVGPAGGGSNPHRLSGDPRGYPAAVA
jgi:NAD(P)-dependent dehydrogenase (short-subunit alcohol dehydrogenase family)